MAQFYTFHDCAGCCGILADALLGHCPVGAIEQSAHARSVLFQRQRDGLLPPFPVWDDTRTFRADNPECARYIEGLQRLAPRLVYWASTPCTDLSTAQGSAPNIHGKESSLLFDTLRIVRHIRPARFILENVPGIAISGLAEIVATLAPLGYCLRWDCFSGAHTGAPHRRKRLFLVADLACGRCEGGSAEPKHAQLGAVLAARNWFASEPNLVRVVHGTAAGLDRLERLGGAYIPQVAALAWETLA